MIINLDIIEDFNTFFNDGNINDPFNYVVDKNNKKYLKIPKDLWNLFSENYGEDYELSSFFSEQTPYKIMFCNEKKVILEEGKIYLNSNNYKDISNRIYNIIQAGRLKSINKLNNFSFQDITIEKKQDYNKKIYFKVYNKGATKKNKNEFEILIDSKNEEEISKIMNNKDTIENSISSNSNKDNLNIQIKFNNQNNDKNSNFYLNKNNELENSKFSNKNHIHKIKKMLKSTSQNNVIVKKKNPIEEEIDEKTQKIQVNIIPNQMVYKNKRIIITKNIREQRNLYGIIGLMNLGNSCYMNSVIQILSNIKSLRDYFLSKNYERDININSDSKGEIAKAFYDLLNEIWTEKNQKKEIFPYKFKNIICKYNPLYNNNFGQDAIQFLIFFLSYLSDDLSKGEKLDKPLNEYEKTQKKRWELYKKINKSKIFDLFFGMNKNEKNCLNLDCKYSRFGFDIFNITHLHLKCPQFILKEKYFFNKIIIVNCYIILYPFNNFNKCICIQYPIQENSYQNIKMNQIIDFIKKITKINSFIVRFDELNNDKNDIIELSGNEYLSKKKNKDEDIKIYFYQNKIEKMNFKNSLDLYDSLLKEKETIFNYYYVENLKTNLNIPQNNNIKLNNKNIINNGFSEFLLTNFKISNNKIQRVGTQQLFRFKEDYSLKELYLSICSTFRNILEKNQIESFSNEKIPFSENKLIELKEFIFEKYNQIKYPFLISYRLQNNDNDNNILIPNDEIIFKSFFSSLNLDIFWIEKNNKMLNELDNLFDYQVFNFFNDYISDDCIRMINHQKNLRLKDLIDFYQAKEILLKENIVCENCQSIIYSVNTIVEIPKVFIFHLERTENGKINKSYIDFDFTFDSKIYFRYSKNEKYELIGIIYYYGSTSNDGHYNCACKNSYTGKWIKFNDNEVISVTENDLKTENTYALIYQQQNLNI